MCLCVSPVVAFVRLGDVTVTKPFLTSTFVTWKKNEPQTKKSEIAVIAIAWRQFQSFGFHATEVGLRTSTRPRASTNIAGRLNFVSIIAPRSTPRPTARLQDCVRRQ